MESSSVDQLLLQAVASIDRVDRIIQPFACKQANLLVGV